jgi:Peptidase inhibitor I78 family
MKHASIAFLAGISLMACSPASEPAPADTMAPTPGPEAAAPVTPETAPPVTAAEDTCGMAQYTSLIGKPITEAGVPAESADVRYIRPNTQVTMDFRADRLNIDIDASEIITGFRCT